MKKIKISQGMLVSIFLIVALCLLFINERWVTDEFICSLLTAIAVSSVTTAIFSLVSSWIDKQNMEEKVYSAFPVIKKCNEYGMIDITTKFPFDNIEIKKDFIDSKEVYVLMNDGKNFISTNIDMISERFQQEEKTTNIILLDYEQTDTMDVLTRKNGHDSTPGYYRDKIKEVIDYHLKKAQKSNTHIINVCLNSNYNTLAIIVTDNYAMISLFRVSSGKDTVPHIIFNKNGSEYERIRKDVMKVCQFSKKVEI